MWTGMFAVTVLLVAMMHATAKWLNNLLYSNDLIQSMLVMLIPLDTKIWDISWLVVSSEFVPDDQQSKHCVIWKWKIQTHQPCYPSHGKSQCVVCPVMAKIGSVLSAQSEQEKVICCLSSHGQQVIVVVCPVMAKKGSVFSDGNQWVCCV